MLQVLQNIHLVSTVTVPLPALSDLLCGGFFLVPFTWAEPESEGTGWAMAPLRAPMEVRICPPRFPELTFLIKYICLDVLP